MQPVTILVTVTTAGTPVQVSTDHTLAGMSILFHPLALNAGAKVYVGNVTAFGKSTGVGLIKDVPTGDDFTFGSPDASNRIHPYEYWVDADTSGDKVLVTYWVG